MNHKKRPVEVHDTLAKLHVLCCTSRVKNLGRTRVWVISNQVCQLIEHVIVWHFRSQLYSTILYWHAGFDTSTFVSTTSLDLVLRFFHCFMTVLLWGPTTLNDKFNSDIPCIQCCCSRTLLSPDLSHGHRIDHWISSLIPFVGAPGPSPGGPGNIRGRNNSSCTENVLGLGTRKRWVLDGMRSLATQRRMSSSLQTQRRLL